MPIDSHQNHHLLRRTRLAILLSAAVAAALLLSPQPQALAGEVHFDPDSPAGKEYALPLDRARDEAAGAVKSDGPAGESAPLFGEGVPPGGGGGGVSPSDGGADGAGSDKNARPQQSAPDQPTKAVVAAIASSEDGGGYGLSSAILWIAAIVALGAVLGLVLKSVQRPGTT